MKKCSKCGVSKALNFFNLDKNKKDKHSAWCKTCAAANTKNWTQNNSERSKKSNAKWRSANRMHILETKRRKAYGTDDKNLFIAQNGMCAICFSDLKLLPERYKHVDHNHTTGKVRGWLCHRCNLGLGKFKDDPALLRAALNYLDAHELV